MEVSFKGEGIVIDRRDYREYDSKVNIYCLEHGYLDLHVRGTKRPKSKLAGHIEPMSQISLMVIKGKQYDYLGSSRINNSFHHLKENIEALVSAGVAMRFVKKLIEPGITDERIYNLLNNFLISLNNKEIGKKSCELTLCFFILKIIYQLGYFPNMDACGVCSKKRDVTFGIFSYDQGSLICKSCESKTKNKLLISKETIDLILASKNGIKKNHSLVASDTTMDELKKILNIYIKYTFRFDLGLL